MRWPITLIAVIGCGGGDDGSPSDATIPACERDCLIGAWIEVTGSCTAICSLSPMPAECAASDCEQTNFYSLADDDSYTLWFSAHSESTRSFTLFTATPGSWALPSTCHLTTNAGTDPDGNAFQCSADTVDLPSRDWAKMSPELETAVTTAAAGTLPVHGTY